MLNATQKSDMITHHLLPMLDRRAGASHGSQRSFTSSVQHVFYAEYETTMVVVGVEDEFRIGWQRTRLNTRWLQRACIFDHAYN